METSLLSECCFTLKELVKKTKKQRKSSVYLCSSRHQNWHLSSPEWILSKVMAKLICLVLLSPSDLL